MYQKYAGCGKIKYVEDKVILVKKKSVGVIMEYDEDIRKLADEYYEEGRDTFLDNRLDEAAILIQNAIHLYKSAGDYQKYTAALNLMGVIYAATGNETMAIDYYLEGLESAIDHGYDNLVMLFYNNIGSRYQELDEHEKAIEYFVKAAKELGNPTCMSEPRYDNWCLVTYINLAASYRHMESYDLAEKYLEMAENHMKGENVDIYKYTFLILKCQLYWSMGRSEYIYQNIALLLESGAKNRNASDYGQDIRDICSLFKDMKEYDYWKRIILDFEKYAKEQNTVYFTLMLTEMWMDYYKTIGETDKYAGLCVDYVELSHRQHEIKNKDRAMAIDIKIQLQEKEAERKHVEELSSTDTLTGLGNRYLLTQQVPIVVKEASGKQQTIAVGVLDIDCFKQHNDTYGHIKGDACLKKVAEILRDTVGKDGAVYRFGGDEFVILFPQGKREQIERTAEQIRVRLGEAGIENEKSTVIPKVTISQGYICFIPNGNEDMDAMIERADAALYYVKNNGRNAYHIIEE